MLSGELPLDDFDQRPERYDNPRWAARGWDWWILKEAKAYREMEQAGYMTKAQIVAKLGGDSTTTYRRCRVAASGRELNVGLIATLLRVIPPRRLLSNACNADRRNA